MAEEVPASASTLCWSCAGAGVRKDKTKSEVQCKVCGGSGKLSRKRKRPAADKPVKEFTGWYTPGPAVPGSVDACADGWEWCALTGRFKILQSVDSHRYSTDDVVTAWVAWRVGQLLGGGYGGLSSSSALRTADIGCGLGSVLLMTAWLHPAARCVGVEAQQPRADAARKSIAYNGLSERVQLVQGDLRDPSVQAQALQAAGGAGFHLVTGTPPYFDVAIGGRPPDEESARCLFEYRGGIEAYCAAAAALLSCPRPPPAPTADSTSTSTSSSTSSSTSTSSSSSSAAPQLQSQPQAQAQAQPHGLFVVCESSLALQRGYDGADAAGLRVLARVDVLPKDGKPPLFCVYIMCAKDAPYVPVTGEGEAAVCLGAGAIPVTASLWSLDAAPVTDAGAGAGSDVSTSTALLPWPDMRSSEYAAALAARLADKEKRESEDEAELAGAGDAATSGAVASASAAAAAEATAAAAATAEAAAETPADAAATAATAAAAAVPHPRYKPRVRHQQSARGMHVEYAGRPVRDEVVVCVRVRGGKRSNRTPEYKRLLWELGKPG